MDVALSNKELTNEALRSDLMLLRLSQSLIIYIGLSECLSRGVCFLLFITPSVRDLLSATFSASQISLN
jgi:hypothetical protein